MTTIEEWCGEKLDNCIDKVDYVYRWLEAPYDSYLRKTMLMFVDGFEKVIDILESDKMDKFIGH